MICICYYMMFDEVGCVVVVECQCYLCFVGEMYELFVDFFEVLQVSFDFIEEFDFMFDDFGYCFFEYLLLLGEMLMFYFSQFIWNVV